MLNLLRFKAELQNTVKSDSPEKLVLQELLINIIKQRKLLKVEKKMITEQFIQNLKMNEKAFIFLTENSKRFLNENKDSVLMLKVNGKFTKITGFGSFPTPEEIVLCDSIIYRLDPNFKLDILNQFYIPIGVDLLNSDLVRLNQKGCACKEDYGNASVRVRCFDIQCGNCICNYKNRNWLKRYVNEKGGQFVSMLEPAIKFSSGEINNSTTVTTYRSSDTESILSEILSTLKRVEKELKES